MDLEKSDKEGLDKQVIVLCIKKSTFSSVFTTCFEQVFYVRAAGIS